MDKETGILHGPEPIYEPGKGGIGFEIYRSLQLHKDKPAINVVETGESCTHGDLLERSIKLAIHLRSKKLKKDDIVCLCSHNQIHSAVPYLAAKFIDVNYASIEPTMPEEDLIYLFKYIQPKVVCIAENVEDKIDDCLRKANVQADVIVLGKSTTKHSLEKIMLEVPHEENFSPVIIEDLHETAIIFFSSGTTGKPKGICLSHYAFMGKLVNVSDCLLESGSFNMSNFTLKLGEDKYHNNLTYCPMYWISGIAFVMIAIFNGSIITLGSTFNSETFWKALDKFKPNFCWAPPGHIVDIYLSWKENKHTAKDYLRAFQTGGGPVRPYHIEYLKEMFPKAANYQMIGCTETSGLFASFNLSPESLELQHKYRESCGQILRGSSFKIIDLDTERPCGYNQQGELRIKTKYIMTEYYKMDSSSCFDEDGWFKTGDLAYINEDNCLVVVDRIKDILLYTLYNIRPSVIEEILAKHPSVHECFVIGIPHPKDNEHPMGVVKLKEGQNDVDSEEIVDYVNKRVPSDRYKIRAGVKFVTEMIKTPTGKIKKIAMKKMILDGQI